MGDLPSFIAFSLAQLTDTDRPNLDIQNPNTIPTPTSKFYDDTSDYANPHFYNDTLTSTSQPSRTHIYQSSLRLPLQITQTKNFQTSFLNNFPGPPAETFPKTQTVISSLASLLDRGVQASVANRVGLIALANAAGTHHSGVDLA